MGLFRRTGKTDTIDTIDLTESEPESGAGAGAASVHAGAPGRCPTCDGFGYIDHIDMVHRYQRQHCRSCGHVWEYTFDEEGDVLDLTDIATGSDTAEHADQDPRQDFGIQL